MSNYNSVTPEFIDELKTLLGEKYVKTDADTLDRYKTDEEADERCRQGRRSAFNGTPKQNYRAE